MACQVIYPLIRNSASSAKTQLRLDDALGVLWYLAPCASGRDSITHRHSDANRSLQCQSKHICAIIPIKGHLHLQHQLKHICIYSTNRKTFAPTTPNARHLHPQLQLKAIYIYNVSELTFASTTYENSYMPFL